MSQESNFRQLRERGQCSSINETKPKNISVKPHFVAKRTFFTKKTKPKNKKLPIIPSSTKLPKLSMTYDEVISFEYKEIKKNVQTIAEELKKQGFEKYDTDTVMEHIDSNIKTYSKKLIDYEYQKVIEKKIDDKNVFSRSNVVKSEAAEKKVEKEALKKELIKHMNWCYKCGECADLINCQTCCISYHKKCYIACQPLKAVFKNKRAKQNGAFFKNTCPECIWGRTLSAGDIVWHKLPGFSWWPARILSYADVPTILGYPPTPMHFPVQYYATKDYAFADIKQMCKFDINFDILSDSKIILKEAIEEANDDYVCSLAQ